MIPEDTEREICVLKGLAAAYVMSSRAQQGVYALQEQILTDLFALFRRTGAAHLDPIFTVLYERATTIQERERVIVDQIASLTDVSAVRLHSEFFSGADSDALAGDVPLPGFGPEIPLN